MRISDDDYCVALVNSCLECARIADYSGCREGIERGLNYIGKRSGEAIDPVELLSVIVDGIRKFYPMNDVHSIATGPKTLEDCRFCIELEQLRYMQGKTVENCRQGGYMNSHNSYLLNRWLNTIGEARYSEGQTDLGMAICLEALWLRPYCGPKSCSGMIESIERHAKYFENEESIQENLNKLGRMLISKEILWPSFEVAQLIKYLFSCGLKENGIELFDFATMEFGATNNAVAEVRSFIEQKQRQF